ncbi:aldehyde reductase [Tabrizicola sp. WMC-M-20]|nr:aldehyde reductase [Tabrizicola sp. WMC-M-20]
MIVLTGASGFIAKHILLQLLGSGHRVRATIRSSRREDEVRAAVLPHLDSDAGQRLEFVTLDLNRDEGWSAALAGATALVHTASPFPIAQPKNPEDVIRPAVDGTLRALRAARDAGVDRVVLTSSMVAVIDETRGFPQDESNWCNPDLPTTTPYAKSKTLAELAAWDFVTKSSGMQLTTINPGLVLGPLLDDTYGSSVGFVKRVLGGKDPMLPNFAFPLVDVRDVALMHLRALERPETAGRRYLATEEPVALPEMGRILKTVYPARRMPTRAAPRPVVRVLALFDPEVRSILPKIGKVERLSNARARSEMDMSFIPAAEALKATAASLIDRKLA